MLLLLFEIIFRKTKQYFVYLYIYIYYTSLLTLEKVLMSINIILHLEPERVEIAHDVYFHHFVSIQIKRTILS